MAAARLKKFFQINMYALPSKIVYFLYGAMIGTHMTFLNIFFTSVGLSAFHAGLITGVRFAAASLAGPLWGALVDYTHRRKVILTVLCLGSAFPIFSMPFVARDIYQLPFNGTCHLQNNGSIQQTEVSLQECQSRLDHDYNVLFWVMLFMTLFASIFVVPLQGYIDTIVMNVVKTAPVKTSYGAQRILGSIGFSIANFVAGIAADHFHHPGLSPYTAVFSMYLPLVLLLIPTVCYILGQANWDADETENEVKETKSDTNIPREVLKMLQKFDVIFYLATVLIHGLANSLFLGFAFLLVEDMGISKTKMTLMVVASSASEIFVFPFTSKLIKLFRGTAPAFTFGMFVFAVRFLLMSFKVPYSIMVLLQLLHCLSFALSWAAIMEHVHTITPDEINVTMNSIMQAIYLAVSALLANLVGGKMFDMYGGRTMFRGKAIICFVWGILMVLYYGGKAYRKKLQRKSVEEAVRYKKDAENPANGNTITGVENPAVEINEDS